MLPQYARFVEEYLVDYDEGRAAERCKMTRMEARDCLRNAEVSEAIEMEAAFRRETLQVSAMTVLRELAIIGFSDLADFAQVDNLQALDPVKRRAIKKVAVTNHYDREGRLHDTTTTVELHPKIDALRMLATNLKLLTERTEIAGVSELAAMVAEARARVHAKPAEELPE
jgi:hypothetical protein